MAGNKAMTHRVVVESLSDQLYRVVCDRIVTGAYPPGSRLDPLAIANEFGVSRTPVRDTLAMLERDRLVETRPRSGTYVAQPTIDDVIEVCDVRKGIEWVATFIATERMPMDQIEKLREETAKAIEAAEQGDFEPFFLSDTHFHRGIIEATANARLMQVRSSIEPFGQWLRVIGATGTHRVADTLGTHLKILEAMALRDAAAAAEAAAIHLDEVKAWTIEDMTSLGLQHTTPQTTARTGASRLAT
ncbi:GntR family transcriptional regulator [Dactylosporangium sp. NPDC000521]|uniref:GntR family transcriptional regulator n=1 Tax=Dactylosporangium sp. NPDC000521 TaxID=3363975 RepID=UPI003698D2B7